MATDAPFNVGHIPYINCVPFFHYLRQFGFCGKLISGVPSELNRMLQQGELDVSPSSSFEYARNWQDYLLLSGHSISSVGPVKSVMLFSPVSVEGLSGKKIAITGDSATSINLLRVMLREFVGLEDVHDEVPQQGVEAVIADSKPALLIGDRAIRAAASLPSGMHCFDLAQLWYQYTGLPFVFALWIVRRESVELHREALSTLGSQLTKSRCRFFDEVDSLSESLCQESVLTARAKKEYWLGIDFGLSDQNIQGLQLFIDLCLKYQLLNKAPQIEFLQVDEKNTQQGQL